MYRSGVNKQFVWDLVSVGTWRGSQEPTGTMGRCAWPTSPCRSLVRAHEEPCTAAHMHTPHTHTQSNIHQQENVSRPKPVHTLQHCTPLKMNTFTQETSPMCLGCGRPCCGYLG